MGDLVAQRDYYLALALELLARADGESDPEKRAGFEALAASYRLTAEQAPHEAGLIIDVELPIEETKPRVLIHCRIRLTRSSPQWRGFLHSQSTRAHTAGCRCW